MKSRLLHILLCVVAFTELTFAAAFHNPYGKFPTNGTPGDRVFAEYFRSEAVLLSEKCLADIQDLEDWKQRRPELRRQLFEMLGLDPLPAKTELKPIITGRIEQAEFVVEKLHFQSTPGLYVTANLYLPNNLKEPAPAILYTCGHSSVKTNGVSYGNKVDYQRHGIWLARHGYVCLVIDTVQLGEIEGIHHGTFREGMWWWNSRGYTPAGAEAWNCVRALDYLETRPEVDKNRLGVTGRSGGGAYSWWIAALDDRIQAACPVAGITDLQNHVIDGTVEGHCDCMFCVNTYRWDYPQVAALVAPRPLLICNSDKDSIFPLEGVARLHEKVRRIYDLYGATDKLGLVITEGPHKDTQELQVPVFRWFNRFLKKDQSLIEDAAVPIFTGQQLKVFQQIPGDEITSKCYESFTTLATDKNGLDSSKLIRELQQKAFGGWPQIDSPITSREVASEEHDGVRLAVYEFESQPHVKLRFYLARAAEGAPIAVHVQAVDQSSWQQQIQLGRALFPQALREEIAAAHLDAQQPVSTELAQHAAGWIRYIKDNRSAYITFTPRAIGLTALAEDNKYQVQVRRRFMLLGQTLAGMQVWDIRRAVQAAKMLTPLSAIPMHLHASPELTEVATFAAVFEPGIASLTLTQYPRPDKEAPDFLNWSRIVTEKQLLHLAEARCKVTIEPHEH